MKTFKQFISEDGAAAVVGGTPSTNVSNVAGIRDGEIPPVAKGITTKGHMLRRKKPVKELAKWNG
jgi:hypothetical protein